MRLRSGGAPRGFSLEKPITSAPTRARLPELSPHARRRRSDSWRDRAPVSWVSGSYFGVLGVEMALGRGFCLRRRSPAAPSAVAVLSVRYWLRQSSAAIRPSSDARVAFEEVPFTDRRRSGARFTGTIADRIDVWMPIGPRRSSAGRSLGATASEQLRLLRGSGRPPRARRYARQAEAELALLTASSERGGRHSTGRARCLPDTKFAAGPKGDPQRRS